MPKSRRLNTVEMRTVARRAREVCRYGGTDTSKVFPCVNFPLDILDRLERADPDLVFTFSKLKKLAAAVGVAPPEFLLEEGTPTDKQMSAAMHRFEGSP